MTDDDKASQDRIVFRPELCEMFGVGSEAIRRWKGEEA